MQKVTVEMFKCECCGKLEQIEWRMEVHEPECFETHERLKKEREECERKVDEAQGKAIEAAKKDLALKLLVANNLEDEAMERARKLYDWEVFYDFGSGYLYEQTCRKMIEVVKSILAPSEDNGQSADTTTLKQDQP